MGNQRPKAQGLQPLRSRLGVCRVDPLGLTAPGIPGEELEAVVPDGLGRINHGFVTAGGG